MTILFIILTLLILITLHELGHFLVAKKYNVKVEEFGIGIPPRAWGKKIGETIYSINWIPLGGFVRMYGEEKKANDERSFSSKPVYQRALIVFAGIAAFFVIAFLVFSLYAFFGVRTLVTDGVIGDDMKNPQVIVMETQENSPAKEAGIEMGDILLEIEGEKVESPEEVISFIEERKGEEINMLLDRRGKEVSTSFVLREESSEEEGLAGIAMVLTAEKSYPFYYAPVKGAMLTGEVTFMVVKGFGSLLYSAVTATPLPPGMEVGGPVAIVDIGAGAFERGINDFLNFVGLITISLAIVNSLPIPALDGGRLLFLAIEKIKGVPVSEKLESAMISSSFVLLIALIIFITIRDIIHL